MYTQISIFGGSEYEKNKNTKAQGSRYFQEDCKFFFIRQSSGGSNARRYTLMINLKLTRDGLYGIYDKLADMCAAVFVAPNDEYAERQFLNLISSPDANIFSLNANDFQLVKFCDTKFDVLRSASDYSEVMICKLRSERASKFVDNAHQKEVKKDE